MQHPNPNINGERPVWLTYSRDKVRTMSKVEYYSINNTKPQPCEKITSIRKSYRSKLSDSVYNESMLYYDGDGNQAHGMHKTWLFKLEDKENLMPTKS